MDDKYQQAILKLMKAIEDTKFTPSDAIITARTAILKHYILIKDRKEEPIIAALLEEYAKASRVLSAMSDVEKSVKKENDDADDDDNNNNNTQGLAYFSVN
jgi:hypothetical protein